MSEDLFATFDSLCKELGSWLEGMGFESIGRKSRGFTLLYPNGWHLFLSIRTSQHNRRANEKYFFSLDGDLYDDEGILQWWWSSTSDRPSRQRAVRDRRWQKIDHDSHPEEFISSLRSDIAAVMDAGGGWEELSRDADPASFVLDVKSWILHSLLPAAESEVGGKPGPPLAGERRSE